MLKIGDKLICKKDFIDTVKFEKDKIYEVTDFILFTNILIYTINGIAFFDSQINKLFYSERELKIKFLNKPD